MFLSWSFRRKLVYSTITVVIAAVLCLLIWFVFFTNTPTCGDGVQNGDERGIDCGGACSLVCQNDSRAPIVLWARSFEVLPGSYTAAAYIQNNNAGAGARDAQYSFRMYDEKNKLIKEVYGMTNIPPVQTVPIIEQNIDVGNRVVVRTLFAFTENQEFQWRRVSQTMLPQIKITLHDFVQEVSSTRVSATLENYAATDSQPLTVIATLFDEQDVARASSKSLLPGLAHTSIQEVVFTWPNGLPATVKQEVIVLPSF